MALARKNRGIIFTLDAIFAGILIVIAITAFSQNFIFDDKTPDLNYLSYDLVKSFSSIKTYELNNSYLNGLIASGVVNNTNNTILETIGELYVLNKTSEAKELARNISAELIPKSYGFAIAVNGEEVYTNNKSVEKSVMTAKRLISGIEKYKPIRGSTSKVYLEGLEEKKDSSYIFFGGFIGQGNISDFTDEIPSDANITNIYAQMEIGSTPGDSFQAFINGVKCDVNMTKNSTEMHADAWNLTSCKGSIVPGARNNLTIAAVPSTNFDIAYISGGFFRFDYKTKQMYTQKLPGYEKYYFNSIDGLINIYTSIYIPGDINNINIQLKYLVNHTNSSNSTFYMKIGNNTVLYDSNSTTVQTIQLDGSVLLSMGMNYSFLSGKNIPIRVGAENVSYFVQYLGTADAVVTTDASGSMGWRMDMDNVNGVDRNCSDPNINSSDTSRISVAKCLDNAFADNMLNVSGNLIGLASYDTSTLKTLNLTSDTTAISNQISNYSAGASTCICCGINSASDILSSTLKKTMLITMGSSWNWTNNSFRGSPLNDSLANPWNGETYQNESQWNMGNATLGHNTGAPSLATDMGSMIFANYSHPFMWENSSDMGSPEADFTHGWNSTGNYFGNATKDNGWDYANETAPYGYESKVNYTGPLNGMITINLATGNPSQNRCANYACSGAYGIEINITPQLFALINQSNGKVLVGFNYIWESYSGNSFRASDELWIKSRWTSPTSGVHYLGTELSSVDNDNTTEVYVESLPRTNFNRYFLTDIKPYVEGPGDYYLDFGAKLYVGNSGNNKQLRFGNASFDNVTVMISNNTEDYYLRKHFYVNDTASVKKLVMNLMSDNSASIYLNGNLVFTDNTKNNAAYWNTRGYNLGANYLVHGDNVLAVDLFSANDFSRFDMELFGVNDSRNKAMIVMTDGQANMQCSRQGTGNPVSDAIQASCDAREKWGISVYAVGYSTSADAETLQNISQCGNGIYMTSANTTLLSNFYNDVAAQIMDVARVEQKIVVTGLPTLSTLFGKESYIEINYTPPVAPPQVGEIAMNFEVPINQNCTFSVNVSPKLRVIDSKVTSYSSSKWTDFLSVDNITTHNLSVFNDNYEFLGDPFIVSFPPNMLHPGDVDTIQISTGIDPSNSSGCSNNDTLLYTGLMKSTISYSDVLEFAQGCKWTVEFEDNTTTVISVPQGYSGSNACNYTSSSRSYDANDTYDDAAYQLFNNLDLDNDGRLDVNLLENDLIIGAISVSKVPYPWGPAIAEVRVWQ